MPLGTGSIAFVGFNADGTDGLAFMTFGDIAAGTVIHFTNNAWDGAAFVTGESVWSWTATSDVAAGTVISMAGLAAGAAATANEGTVSFSDETARGIADTREIIYAYTGDAAAPTFLTAIANGSTYYSDSGIFNNTGLEQGINAISFENTDNETDIAVYTGPRATGEDLLNLQKVINDPNNWTTQNTAADDSADGTGPDAPFATTPFVVDPAAQKVSFAADTLVVSHAEGDNGPVTYTFVVERTNGTTGTVNFTGYFGSGYTDPTDYLGGNLEYTFAGTIAAGEISGMVSITVNGDHAWEADEDFKLYLYSVANDSATAYLSPDATETVATGHILNDDTRQIIGFAADSTRRLVVEGNDGTKTITFTMERSGDGGTDGDVAFSGWFVPSSVNAADFGGTLPPSAFSGIIPAGQASATITVTISSDQSAENNEFFTLMLDAATNPAAENVALGTSFATAYILNDDGPTVVHSGENIGEGNGTNVTVGLTGDSTLTIEQGGAISDGVSIAGHDFDVTINNAGTFMGAFYYPEGNGKITFNNAASGVAGHLVVPKYAGADSLEFTLNNAGAMGTVWAKQNTTYKYITINNLADAVIDSGTLNETTIDIVGNATINNAGTIINTLSYGKEGIEFRGTNVVINNLAGGRIEGGHHALTGKTGVVVTNEAGATMIGRNGSAVNIDNSSDVENTVFVTNHGVMEGRSANVSDSDGDAIDVDGLAVIENWGSIKGLGHNARHDGEPNVSEAIAAGAATITNHQGGEIYGYGRAIQIDNSSNSDAYAATTIINDGLIKGDGNLPTAVTPEEVAQFAARLKGGEAINIEGSFADTLTNTGTIIGGVRMGGGNDTLFNSGNMTATGGSAVDMGVGDDVVVNFTGGVIQGAILLGTGDDRFFGNESAENVDGGQGADLLTGGGGNDTLKGGDGSDVYSYTPGEGSDTVVEGPGAAGDADMLLFDEITATGAILQKHGSDVEIVLANGDVITLKDQLAGGGVENIVFSDGASFDRESIVAHLVNRGPVAVADQGVADENEGKLFDLVANDTDADGDALSLSGFSVTGVSGIGLNNAQAQAAFSIQNGQLAFNPGNLFDGLNDGDTAAVTVSYTVQDAAGASSTAEFVLTVNGSTDGNVIVGSNGADPLFGTEGVDIVSANGGNDTVFGRGGDDIIDAGNGTDTVFGGAGNDIIDGGAGKDTLMGDAGDDVVAGGLGNDLMYGGEGNDTFVFHAGEGRDVVFDFQAGAGAGDVIELDHSLFADFEALMAAGAVTDTSIGAQISYGDGSTITLSGIHKADLAIDDFRFA